MNQKPAKYLDKILKVLADNFDQYLTVNELKNKIEPVKIFGEVGDVKHSPDLLIELRTALDFLESQKLIHYYPGSAQEVTLSYAGYLKIQTNSFTKEINEKSINKMLQRLSWVVPILISFAALMVSILKEPSNTTVKSQKHHCHNERLPATTASHSCSYRVK